MLCWHTEIVVTPEIMCRYLVALVQRLHHFNLLAPHDVPRINVLMSILFALRVREKDPDFLIKNNDDLRTSLLALIDPPDPPGILSGVPFPPSMLANMGGHFSGNFSKYVARFIRNEDTVADRELGSSIGTMQ